VITELPVQPARYVTSPVDGLILFPAAMLAASRLYVIPVLSVDVAVYVIVPAPGHLVEVVPNANTGVPTVGVIVIVCVAVAFPLQPVAFAVMTVVPDQLEA
jgi:hypothetical protein